MKYFNEELINKVLYNYMDLSKQGIIIINSEGIIVYHNKYAIEYNNLPTSDIIGKDIRDFFPNSDLFRIMKKGIVEKNYIGDYYGRKLICDRSPIINDNGGIEGAYAIFRDIEDVQASEMDIRVKLINKGHVAKYDFRDIYTTNPGFNSIINKAKIYAKTSSPILIVGESGTGKEMFAQSIHNASERSDKPFVALNCTTLTESILESELFGYADSSFTGAKKGGKIGLFQQAHRGTLFLDEIGDMPLVFQAKLLRVLQEKEIRPVGSDKIIPVDVRIISATSKDLVKMVNNKQFRLDLFYRLNMLIITIPPLRERKEDILYIGTKYLKKFYPLFYANQQNTINKVLLELHKYPFYGNIRELINKLERLMLLLTNNRNSNTDILINEFSEEESKFTLYVPAHKDNEIQSGVDETTDNDITKTLEEIETKKIKNLLIKYNGSKSKVAKAMGISISTLRRRMIKYAIK